MDVIDIFFSFIGSIGGIYAIYSVFKSRCKPKPNLKILEVEYKIVRDSMRGRFGIKVNNNGNMMATGINCVWVIIRKDTGERVLDSSRRTTELGIIGPKCTVTQFIDSSSRMDPTKKHEIWIALKCNERTHDPVKMNLKTDFLE